MTDSKGDFEEAFFRIIKANDNSVMSLLRISGLDPSVDLIGSYLADCAFDYEIIEEFNFTQCDLRMSSFVDCRIGKCKFDEADLRECNFSNAVITNTSFSGARLAGARFDKAHLPLLSAGQIADVKVDRGMPSYDPNKSRISKHHLLTDAVIKATGFSKRDAEALVNVILSSITEALRSGDKVRIRNFGLFYTSPREGYVAVDRATGQETVFKRVILPRFRAEKALRDLLNR